MRHLLRVLVMVGFVLAGFPLVGASGADGEVPSPLMLDVTDWQRAAAPLPTAGDGVGPGSYLLITMDAGDDSGTYICTANFVWRDGATTYLGAAGHCFLPPGQTKAVGSNPWVTKVEVCVEFCAFGGQLGYVVNGTFAELGSVVYARQNTDSDADDQIGHDFGLATIPASLASQVRPEMPVWGGPTSVNDTRAGAVCMYGNGLATGEAFATKARTGIRFVEGLEDEGWEAEILINGGDSGSAINMCDAGSGGLSGTDALGIVTHGLGVGAVPTPYAFGTTVAEAKAMVQADMNRSIDIVLADGVTTPPVSGTNTAPTASFVTTCSDTSSTCSFDGTGSQDTDGTVTSYAWNFGDGSTATGSRVSHSFGGSRNATYVVTLTVTDDDGATASATNSVTCSGKGKNRRCQPT